jgi:DNA-binding NarL/FixJ family response regulator
MVIAVVDDLLFSSKIRAVAQAAGAQVVFARSREVALAAAVQHAPGLVIFDLDPRTGDVIDTIRLMRDRCGPATRMIGFGAHVNVERLQAARDAGCDEAIARSAFVAALRDLMTSSAAETRQA